MQTKISLAYEIERFDTGVVDISYRVVNKSEAPVYLLTHLPDSSNTGTLPSSSRVYVFIDPQGILHITKRLWYTPDDVDIYMPEAPLATRISPGGSFDEKISLREPIRIDYPYRYAGEEPPPDGAETITVESRGVAFSIGYLGEGQPPLPVERVSASGAQGVAYLIDYSTLAEHQMLIQGEAMNLGLFVQDLRE